MKREILRAIAHIVFRGRRFNNRHVKRIAAGTHDRAILEIGSGKPVKGEHRYSARVLFDESNDFVQTDVNPEFGHQILDVTTMEFEESFDIVLCVNVMEHVYEFRRAFDNVHRALKPGGTALIGVPGYYPLHDEPHDYWRFTEHALRRLMSPYRSVKLWRSGPRRYPFAYFLEATK